MGVMNGQKCVMVVAGEASGDQHGAKLVSAMRCADSEIFFCGIGSSELANAGVRILVDAATLTVVGITEVISKLPVVFRSMAIAKKLLQSLKPDLLILIDFPDFNLRLAAVAKKLGIRVLYYISPQIWAWRPGRVKKIGRLIDHMAVILPFEADFYSAHNIPVTFVGHPLLDDQSHSTEKGGSNHPAENNTIGLLPGSREVEIRRLLPVMLDAAENIHKFDPHLKFVVSVAPTVDSRLVKTIAAERKIDPAITFCSEPVSQIFSRCRLVVAASGTVTLQAAITGTPMVIIYKVSPISYWLGRALIRVNHIGLINLIAEKRLVPELVQDQASVDGITEQVFKLLEDEAKLFQLKKELLTAKEKLGSSGASKRVADIALSML
jgi:lipid-A-disaccharide synthase